jgi:hypothetical protein
MYIPYIPFILAHYPEIAQWLEEHHCAVDSIQACNVSFGVRLKYQEEVGWSGYREYAHTGADRVTLTFTDGKMLTWRAKGVHS